MRVDVGATLTDLVNNNLISGASTGGARGYGVANAGAITTLTNSKNITGSYAGLYNAGSIPTLNNTANASVTGAVYGIYDAGAIGALNNAGSINAITPINPAADATGFQVATGGSIGAFIDHSLVRREPQGLKFGDPQPLIGAFLGYDQEGEGRGLQGKLTAAMNLGAVTLTRANGLAETEPGSGKASLNSFGVAGEIGWGLALDGETLVTPYLGLRHTLARRGAYGESAVASVVDFPLSYTPFSQSLTTATTGMRLKGQVTDKIGFQLGLGVEYDLAQKASAYAGASAIPGLETFALPGAEVSNRFRPTGNVGLFYQIDGTQRLTGNVTVRGETFSNHMAVNVMGGYQAAF